ncbi:MerR family transcriptional regulator [Inconstantimicrobium porci]|uniref:MerR family transcriptional regulator n=1 Tax=Inconstantimicrobium porci TaxID=2652291 RepID=A0A7X2T309_9CLOT|nr:MerR family transcriptional regulator [Inconstantimicrobium porci]MDD6769545.1 MerR family transcriptional regulator [Inconstantimicrobium porci]MSR92523.1 MerR family transcriptional regulator [Inconstantimicrobium porci]
MEYTIKKLAEIAGVSARTLRYYDEIGLLRPCRINSSGYRIYGENEVDMLQQIMFYKSMGMSLEEINRILSSPDFNIEQALLKHREELIEKRKEIDQLILTVEKTLLYEKGEAKMKDKEKFEGFKKGLLDENEAKYGKEIRKKYSNDTIEKSNKKFMNMNKVQFDKMNKIEAQMIESLKNVIHSGDMNSKDAENIYNKHKEWINFTWPSYSKEAHAGLAEMYVADDRFRKYYNDKAGMDCVDVLRDIIVKYCRK